MAGGQERALRRRIKSVQSTKKITRAMELIAATRVVKAQERANAARPYSQQITNVILDLVGLGAQASHPLLRENSDANRSAFVVMTSDRGLSGAYNSAVIRAAERELVARKAEGKEDDPFEIHVISMDAYTVDGCKRLEDKGITDVIVGFRMPYIMGPDTEPLQKKIDHLNWYGENLIAKVNG